MAAKFMLLIFLFPALMCISTAAANKSDVWSSVEQVLLDSGTVGEESDEFSGGFSTLDGMLQWAVGHSDPEKLKEKADYVQNLSLEERITQQQEIKELVERMKMPSDAELMKIAINDLNNSSISLEDRQRALNELLILVEPIDNANDLNKLGGVVAVIRELRNVEPAIRTTSAWVLGKASQNNALVQDQILDYGALERLMEMARSTNEEEAIKALYAISSLIRNNERGQDLFNLQGGIAMLQDVFGRPTSGFRLQKKAVHLVHDMADFQLTAANHKITFLSNQNILESVVDLALRPDLHLQEKALLAIKSLLQLSPVNASDFRDFCRLDVALETMRKHLEELQTQEDHREYAAEVEGLRTEVHHLFQTKLDKAM